MKVNKNWDSELYQFGFSIRALERTFTTGTQRGKVSRESSFQSHHKTKKQGVRTSNIPKRMGKEVWPTCNKIKTSAAKIVGLAAMLPSEFTYFQKTHVKLKWAGQRDPSLVTEFSRVTN